MPPRKLVFHRRTVQLCVPHMDERPDIRHTTIEFFWSCLWLCSCGLLLADRGCVSAHGRASSQLRGQHGRQGCCVVPANIDRDLAVLLRGAKGQRERAAVWQRGRDAAGAKPHNIACILQHRWRDGRCAPHIECSQVLSLLAMLSEYSEAAAA